MIMPSFSSHGKILAEPLLAGFGLSPESIRESIQYTHSILDRIDQPLIEETGERITSLIELANLSAIIGNLFRFGVSRSSKGIFRSNKPHTFPDLLSNVPSVPNLEIKVALESNKPKGHLIKPGPHLIVRYVLGTESGQYMRGVRPNNGVAWIWEVRVGFLEDSHFNFSNTPGDSGKTAVITAAGMRNLSPVFLDLDKCPLSPNGSIGRELATLVASRIAENGHLRRHST